MVLKQGKACVHLLEEKHPKAYSYFTGASLDYHIICENCAKVEDFGSLELRETDEELFDDLTYEIEGLVGAPEVKERPSELHFEHQSLDMNFADAKALAFHARGQNWLVCLDSGRVLEFDSKGQKSIELFRFTDEDLSLNQAIMMRVSADERYVAIVQQKGQFGFVWDSISRHIHLRLNRGNYHANQSIFPIAFCVLDGETLVIHGTDWNRLDISQAATGELLTKRIQAEYKRGERPEHYLDYFHGALYVSPNNQWVAEYGWVWHPVGVSRAWNLKHWYLDNVWESEDGDSVQSFVYSHYFWDSPMVWVDDKTLGIWGFGRDDYWMVDALSLHEMGKDAKQRWISGIKRGELVFDTYLFSITKTGTEVWDISSGERLHYAEDFLPKAHNTLTKEFISRDDASGIQISRLHDTQFRLY